jgi:hypothetical protein
MKPECEFCADECQQQTETECMKLLNYNQKPDHRHIVNGEAETRT